MEVRVYQSLILVNKEPEVTTNSHEVPAASEEIWHIDHGVLPIRVRNDDNSEPFSMVGVWAIGHRTPLEWFLVQGRSGLPSEVVADQILAILMERIKTLETRPREIYVDRGAQFKELVFQLEAALTNMGQQQSTKISHPLSGELRSQLAVEMQLKALERTLRNLPGFVEPKHGGTPAHEVRTLLTLSELEAHLRKHFGQSGDADNGRHSSRD